MLRRRRAPTLSGVLPRTLCRSLPDERRLRTKQLRLERLAGSAFSRRADGVEGFNAKLLQRDVLWRADGVLIARLVSSATSSPVAFSASSRSIARRRFRISQS